MKAGGYFPWPASRGSITLVDAIETRGGKTVRRTEP